MSQAWHTPKANPSERNRFYHGLPPAKQLLQSRSHADPARSRESSWWRHGTNKLSSQTFVAELTNVANKHVHSTLQTLYLPRLQIHRCNRCWSLILIHLELSAYPPDVPEKLPRYLTQHMRAGQTSKPFLGQKWDKPWQTEKPKKPTISDDSWWSKPCRTCAWTCSGRSLCASEHARGAKIKSMILSNAFWHDSIVSCFGDVSPCSGIMFVLSLSGSTDHHSPHHCL